MKKTVAILLVTLMALSFVACASEKIIGTWELTDTSSGRPPITVTYKFNDQGKVLVAGIRTWRYKINGNKLTLMELEQDVDCATYKLKFSGNTMTMTDVEDSGHWFTFTKK